MLNSIIRFYNLNKGKIWRIIIIVVAIILIIQVLNSIAKNSREESSNVVNGETSNKSQSSSKSPNVMQTQVSTGGSDVSKSDARNNQMLIANFVSYCNNKSITDAYNMLSEECKKELFSTEDEFNNKYLKKIFTNKKDYNIEAWKNTSVGVTYSVTYVDDILSTGKVGTNTEDYITVDGNGKLNIFRFIGSEKLNKSASNDIATIQILDKVVYDDYEKYSIRVTNNTKNTIMINRKEDNDGIYTVYSGSSEKYSAFISEIYEQNLTIEANQTKYLSIRINKLYTGDSAVKKMVFSDIIKNKKEFEEYETKSLYTDVSTIEMNF